MRSALTLLFILLSGCALPEGKLIAAASKDAGTKRRDAVVPRTDSTESSFIANDAAAASSTPAAIGGAKSEPNHDADAGPAATPEPKANGETCNESSECASDNCKSGPDGRRCYGLLALDKACSGAYDCDGYACISATSDGTTGVCVDTSTCTTRDRCAQDYWAATCHLDQLCSAQPSSFNQCYKQACTRPRDSNDLCMKELANAKQLIALRCCPPAGAYHSSCDPAPQCGCKDGEKCDVVGNDGQTSCVKAGAVPELGECEGESDCMVGYVCTGSGCRRYCDGPDDRSCTPNGACRPVAIVGLNAPGAFICSHLCDPTSPGTANGPFDSCGSGRRCEPAPDGNSDCFPGGGEGRQGAACDKSATADPHACAPGFACITGSLRCAQYCKVAADDCQVGTCRSNVGDKLFAFNVEIGFCASP